MITGTRHPTLFHPDVEVRVSKRRKKTAGAHWEGDRIVVVVPTHLRGAELDQMVDELSARLARHRPHLHASDELLEERAAALGRRYLDGVAPASIRWSTNQNKRWGSCTIPTGEIRISDRLRVAPEWVLDAVIVHELAHLLEPNHSPRFRRARGALSAAAGGRHLPGRVRAGAAHARPPAWTGTWRRVGMATQVQRPTDRDDRSAPAGARPDPTGGPSLLSI